MVCWVNFCHPKTFFIFFLFFLLFFTNDDMNSLLRRRDLLITWLYTRFSIFLLVERVNFNSIVKNKIRFAIRLFIYTYSWQKVRFSSNHCSFNVRLVQGESKRKIWRQKSDYYLYINADLTNIYCDLFAKT